MVKNNYFLGPRFEKALQLALNLHQDQFRKSRQVPYISHLLAVAALVLQDGGSEDEAIAALLHDAPEDQGGEETLKMIQDEFGDTIDETVKACSDTLITPKPPWRSRKEAHLEAIRNASPSVHRVVLADKLHNARSLLRDLKVLGPEVWQSFNGRKEGSLWYLRSMHHILHIAHPGYLADEFGRVLIEIEALANDNTFSGGKKTSIETVNFKDKLKLVKQNWTPKIIAQLNDYHFKLVKVDGAFVWHDHAETDEVFIVLKGSLEIALRDKTVHLGEGEMIVIPKGVEHKPISAGECHVLLVEPAGTVNTGEVGGEMNAPNEDWV